VKNIFVRSNIEHCWSVSDWLIIMIGPGGLLLVVPQFAVPAKKEVNNYTWM
jgi:hypothetical protein